MKISQKIKAGALLLAAAVLLTACSGGAASSSTASSVASSASSVAATSETAASSEAAAVSSEAASSEAAPSGNPDAENVHVIDGVTFIVRDAPNDVTGNWRFASISESFNMSEHALEYYNECFGGTDEIHYVINEADNTTTQLSYVFGNIDVIVREHIEDEEFDAKTLGSGDILAEYFVDVSTGEIEQAQ